jgi:ribosomal protein L11 methylase PrmA
MLWDLGCNRGRYGEAALAGGARYVVGFDSDAGALHQAFARAQDRGLRFLPLLVDLANPTPSQGWRERECEGLIARGRPEALLALAVIHHLAIARNVPLDEIVMLLTSLAPEGVVGFVPNTDARAQALFRGRDEIFRSYTLENFLSLLRSRARIVRQQSIPNSERVLIWFSTT